MLVWWCFSWMPRVTPFVTSLGGSWLLCVKLHVRMVVRGCCRSPRRRITDSMSCVSVCAIWLSSCSSLSESDVLLSPVVPGPSFSKEALLIPMDEIPRAPPMCSRISSRLTPSTLPLIFHTLPTTLNPCCCLALCRGLGAPLRNLAQNTRNNPCQRRETSPFGLRHLRRSVSGMLLAHSVPKPMSINYELLVPRRLDLRGDLDSFILNTGLS